MASTTVTTRFALTIGCARNSGIMRAATMLPRNPIPSSAVPARNDTVSIAVIVDRNDGASPGAPVSSTLCAPRACNTDAVPYASAANTAARIPISMVEQ